MTHRHQKILVTGGAGFIGSHLVDRLLNEGFEATAIDNLDTGHLESIVHHQGRQEFHFMQYMHSPRLHKSSVEHLLRRYGGHVERSGFLDEEVCRDGFQELDCQVKLLEDRHLLLHLKTYACAYSFARTLKI